MIVIELLGGLGNQMFQYAFAAIIAKKSNTYVKLNNDFFNLTEKKAGHTPRKFELDIFNVSNLEASKQELRKFTNLSKINRYKKKLGWNYPKKYFEPSFNFQNEAIKISAPAYIRGYFQSYKYFKNHKGYLRQVFTFPLEKLNKRNKDLLSEIERNNSVSIHIRRGDYVKDDIIKQTHGSCSLDYYLNAIELIATKTKDFNLIFFSDDIEWVKEQFDYLSYSKIFVDNNKDDDSWVDMLLMQSCNHNIIANSSFSWWAAWLNSNTEKVVIAPKQWFAKSEKEKNTNDLIPPEWIQL